MVMHLYNKPTKSAFVFESEICVLLQSLNVAFILAHFVVAQRAGIVETTGKR